MILTSRLLFAFIALLALKDQMGQVDAEQAAILLGEIRRLRVDGGAEQTNKCPAGTVLTGTKCVAKAVEKPKLDRHNHGGHSYAILPRATSWHEASALCKNQNAHLATVGNAKD